MSSLVGPNFPHLPTFTNDFFSLEAYTGSQDSQASKEAESLFSPSASNHQDVVTPAIIDQHWKEGAIDCDKEDKIFYHIKLNNLTFNANDTSAWDTLLNNLKESKHPIQLTFYSCNLLAEDLVLLSQKEYREKISGLIFIGGEVNRTDHLQIALTEFLEGNTTLKVLQISDFHQLAGLLPHVIGAIQGHNVPLIQLNLSNNALSKSDVEVILKWVSQNKQLESLDLTNTCLNSSLEEVITAEISQTHFCSSLTTLVLSANTQLTFKDVTAFLTLLPALRELEISEIQLPIEELLPWVLEHHAALKDLVTIGLSQTWLLEALRKLDPTNHVCRKDALGLTLSENSTEHLSIQQEYELEQLLTKFNVITSADSDYDDPSLAEQAAAQRAQQQQQQLLLQQQQQAHQQKLLLHLQQQQMQKERQQRKAIQNHPLILQIKNAAQPTTQLLNAMRAQQNKSIKEAAFIHLLKFQFEMHPMADDGNCLFAAIATALATPEETKETIRNKAAQEVYDFQTQLNIQSPENDHIFFLSHGRQLSDYCQNMALDKTWGGMTEVEALMRYTKRPIYVYDIDNTENRFDDNGYMQVPEWMQATSAPANGHPIHLLLINSHYSLLQVKPPRNAAVDAVDDDDGASDTAIAEAAEAAAEGIAAIASAADAASGASASLVLRIKRKRPRDTSDDAAVNPDQYTGAASSSSSSATFEAVDDEAAYAAAIAEAADAAEAVAIADAADAAADAFLTDSDVNENSTKRQKLDLNPNSQSTFEYTFDWQ